MTRRPKPSGRRARPLERTTGTVALPPTLFVACEGKTEAALLESLRGRWRIATVRVAVVAEVGVPMTVVRRAVAELKKKPKGDRPDEAWAVFDRDEHPKYNDALRTARAKGVHLAHSNPCFELWGILLHRDQTAHIERDKTQHALKELHPSYDHAKHAFLDLETALEHLDDAAVRAQKLLARAKKDGEPDRNPTTRFHELIARLRALGEHP